MVPIVWVTLLVLLGCAPEATVLLLPLAVGLSWTGAQGDKPPPWRPPPPRAYVPPPPRPVSLPRWLTFPMALSLPLPLFLLDSVEWT